MKKVLVLLSTYNGEKFLKDQIDSIFQNSNYDISILIRDDGSTDETINIINSINDKRISYYIGNNLGAAMSFIDLIFKAPDADFYAYCDQDDIWKKEKFDHAIKKLEQVNGYGLYMSTYDVVDENLKLIKKANMKFDYPYTLGRTIVHGCPSGCTMIFNQKLHSLLKLQKPPFIRMHDYWTLLVTEAMHGTIITDNESQLLYRQHGNNTVGYENHNYILRIKRLLYSAIYKKNERQHQSNSILYCYNDLLPKDSKRLLEQVKNYNITISNKFKLISNPELMPKEMVYKILFIFSVLTGIF